MGAKKEAEAMGLAVMRERFRLAAKSSVVNWEPHEIADMALTLEALAESWLVTLRLDSTGKERALEAARKVKP